MSFLNKVVLVTGGSSGIGASTAILFSQQGADVAIIGRNEAKLQDVYETCAKKPLMIQCDLSIEDDVKKAVEETITTFGKIDVLVNNAGIVRYTSITNKNILQTYDEVMATNLRAVVNITNLVAPFLLESKGNIINISSIAGSMGWLPPNLMVYGMSKAGLDYFTRSLAMELAEKGVRANAISPGPVRTDVLINANDNTPWEALASVSPLAKVAEPEELADLIMFLASDRAKSITGVNYVVDNGMLVKH